MKHNDIAFLRDLWITTYIMDGGAGQSTISDLMLKAGTFEPTIALFMDKSAGNQAVPRFREGMHSRASGNLEATQQLSAP